MKKLLTLIVSLLLIVTMAFMAACTPKDVESAKAKMDEAGYIVVGYENKDAEGLVGGFVATKITETITAALFDDKESAKDFAEAMGEKAVQDGKWVYFGSEGAIKAFTK